MNVVMQDASEFIEIQGTGEHTSFSRDTLNQLLDLSEKACQSIKELQLAILNQDTLP